MDLRNQSTQLHYIHVIKKGTVVELMSQSPFGLPARKFRDINDIYDDEDSLCDITLAGRKLGSGASKADCNNRMRMLICSAGASLWKDSFSDEDSSVSRTYDSISDESTLQQILKKTKKKGKKRKTPESGFGKEMSTTCEEHSVSQADDDLSDLILPLSCLVPNVRKKRRVKVVKDPNLSYPSQNAQIDFDKYEAAPLDEYHQKEMESTTQHSSLASSDLPPSCPHNEDDNSDCSFYSLNSIRMSPTTVVILGESGDSSQGSNMIMEENAGSLVQNQESLYDCLTTYSPRVLTMLKKTENQEYPDVAFQSLQLGYLYDLPVSKLSLQEDDSATVYSDVSMNAISPSMDLASEELDRSKPQPFTNEICSQAGNDPLTFPCTTKASVKAEVSAMPGLVCESVQQLSQSPPIVLDEDVRRCSHVTPLPDACLHAPSSHSVDHISGECGNSEPCCIESELNSLAVENPVTDEPFCFESELDSRAAENLISDKHGNSEPCCTESEMDSVVVENLVESDILSVRFTINEENGYLPSSEEICQSLRADPSHLHLSKLNVKDGTSTEPLLDLPSDAFTSPGYHTSDNNDLMDMHRDGMNLAGQLNPVNQDIDDQFVASPKYELDIEGERLHMVKEIIVDTKASSPRDKLIINSAEGMCKLASSTLSCYSDSGIPTTHTAQYDETPLATSCCITETSNSMSTVSCGSLDKPLPPEMLERKDSPPSLQNELWRAMENIDTIDSREKLRSLGKLVSDNQIKKKKQTVVKGSEIKGYGQVNKSPMSKQSETKRSCSALELKHSGIKMARLLSSPGRDKKKGHCIPSGPEGAILFSKKQMQDFEALTYKLTRELASMKEIIEERLSHEAGTPDHINDQVTTAINKASKTQQTARKRLSAMNRDCIRFCTIMKISENNNKVTANSETTAQKKHRKKIKFADEAGGELCQIKFIESGEVNTPTVVASSSS